MRRSMPAVLALVLGLTATLASADVTVKSTMSLSGPMPTEMATAIFIKGTKMRSDAKVNGQDVSLIVDLATKQRVTINHSTKAVQEFDPMGAIAAMPVSLGEPTVSLKATGEKKDVAGRPCQGFALRLAMPMTVANETVTTVMSGPVCAAADVPGAAEYRAFFKAAAEAGVVTSPMAQGPQSKGMPAMQRAMSEHGIPLEQELQISVEGTGQVAQMMAQMAMGMTSRVTELSADPIPDALFAIPEGYTKK